MTLTGELCEAMGKERARSFELMGEALTLVTGPRLIRAAHAYTEALEALPARIRPAFEREQGLLLAEAHDWLCRYNRSVHTRLQGYLKLGQRCGFAYPWPVVAMLGICQVMSGMARSHAYALLGFAARRLRIEEIEVLVEGSGDVLRRTNRGIFADSVPTVLYALHCAEVRRRGDGELADALVEGPLPPVMDEPCRTIIRQLDRLLKIPRSPHRFRDFAALTMHHFEREQEIFSHHIGVSADAPQGEAAAPLPRLRGIARRITALPSVPAPVIVGSAGRRRLTFRPYRLPPGFDIRDHATRVAAFGRAFVESVTGREEDYQVAVDYVSRRFSRRRPR